MYSVVDNPTELIVCFTQHRALRERYEETATFLGRTVTALGDLYDRVGVLDGKGARPGHASAPIEIEDDGSSVEFVEEGEAEEGRGEPAGEVAEGAPAVGEPRRAESGSRAGSELSEKGGELDRRVGLP